MIHRLYEWYGKRTVQGISAVLGVLVIIAIAIIVSGKLSNTSDIQESVSLPEVTLRSVRVLQSTQEFSVIGIVRAVSEAQLETEAGGRITSVPVQLGDTVTAGTIIATIENSGAKAGLLQAQGAYESALVSSQKDDTSLSESKVIVRNAYRDTFSSVDNVVHNVIDKYFTNPDEGIGGFRLSGTGEAPKIVAERRAIGVALTNWSLVLNEDRDITEEKMLADTEETLITVSNFTARLALLVSDENENDQFSDAERASRSAELASARTAIDASLRTISQARTVYEQAKLTSSNGTVSESSAQLKTALGMLRSAESNYEKTLVRTPISGVVNALYLKSGDYVSSGMPAAIVANNGSLEITASLGEDDLETIRVGDSVLINNNMATGTIVTIAPAIDPQTGKIEVRINVDSAGLLKNGSTVTVSFTRNVATDTNVGKISIPLSAIKLLPSGPIAFSVTNNTLVAIPVTLGEILGNTVEIQTGLTPESEIVVDARGLNEGDQVHVMVTPE